jgi:hypothetical protein
MLEVYTPAVATSVSRMINSIQVPIVDSTNQSHLPQHSKFHHKAMAKLGVPVEVYSNELLLSFHLERRIRGTQHRLSQVMIENRDHRGEDLPGGDLAEIAARIASRTIKGILLVHRLANRPTPSPTLETRSSCEREHPAAAFSGSLRFSASSERGIDLLNLTHCDCC